MNEKISKASKSLALITLVVVLAFTILPVMNTTVLGDPGDIELIAKIAPANDGFVGMVDADQVIGGGAAGTLPIECIPNGTRTVGIIFIIDGIGTAITTGEKGHLEIPFNCTIQQVTMAADQTGSIVVDIWKDTYANFPPTVADSITNVTPPTITTALKSQDSTLTNWTTTITTGDILAYNVDSCTNITRLTVSLQAVKT